MPRADLCSLSCPVLIRLKKKGDRCAIRSQFVQPICLPEPSSPFPAGHKCQIAGWGHQDESESGGGAGPRAVVTGSLAQPESTLSADVSGYSSSLREALVPLVADHKCSSPEVYGADISPNMLCAGYFDCKSDACQVSQGCPRSQDHLPPTFWGLRATRDRDPQGQPGSQGRECPCQSVVYTPRMGTHIFQRPSWPLPPNSPGRGEDSLSHEAPARSCHSSKVTQLRSGKGV